AAPGGARGRMEEGTCARLLGPCGPSTVAAVMATPAAAAPSEGFHFQDWLERAYTRDRPLAFRASTPGEWRSWQDALRQKVLDLAGLVPPPERCPADVTVLDGAPLADVLPEALPGGKGLGRERSAYTSEPGVRVSGGPVPSARPGGRAPGGAGPAAASGRRRWRGRWTWTSGWRRTSPATGTTTACSSPAGGTSCSARMRARSVLARRRPGRGAAGHRPTTRAT